MVKLKSVEANRNCFSGRTGSGAAARKIKRTKRPCAYFFSVRT